jgi:hypothetical protein
MSDIYYDAQSYGLEIAAEVDDPEACYSFDMVVVWRRIEDGRLFWQHDSGCSCPSPFEDIRIPDLYPLTNDHEWDKFREYMDKKWCEYAYPGRVGAERHRFISEVRALTTLTEPEDSRTGNFQTWEHSSTQGNDMVTLDYEDFAVGLTGPEE